MRRSDALMNEPEYAIRLMDIPTHPIHVPRRKSVICPRRTAIFTLTLSSCKHFSKAITP